MEDQIAIVLQVIYGLCTGVTVFTSFIVMICTLIIIMSSCITIIISIPGYLLAKTTYYQQKIELLKKDDNIRSLNENVVVV
jgi:hypothetical protein